MRAGLLRHRIRIDERVETQQTDGGTTTTWREYSETRARFEVLTGREFLASDEIRGETSHRITMRYLPGLRKSMRIVRLDDERVFDITSIVNLDERNRTLILLANEKD